jgi:hypothetical protein
MLVVLRDLEPETLQLEETPEIEPGKLDISSLSAYRS